jgi:hypothetical protein
LYASPNIVRVIKSRRMRWVGHVACKVEMKNSYNILVGKPWLRREDNIRMNIKEIVCEGMEDVSGSG